MELPRELAQMDAEKLRNLTATLIAQLAERDARISEHERQLASRDKELQRKQLKIDQLTHEMATLKRWQYGRHSEQLDAVQRSLLDESIDADIEAISLEIEALKPKPSTTPKSQPKRVALPAQFPVESSRTSPKRPDAAVVAVWNASARTSVRSSITRRACLRSSSMCAANGCAGAASG